MERIGNYTIIGHLGSGGQAYVYLASAPDGTVCVLKRMFNPQDDPHLLDEARVGAAVKHPAVVETLGVIEHEGRPVLILKYLSGISLAQLRKAGPAPTAVVARWGRQIAEGLHAIHAAVDEDGRPLKAVHRDVTPANIILGHDGDACLIDLGIARYRARAAEHTDAGVIRGTLRYVAPEVIEGREQHPGSDLWSLGICLFETCLGRPVIRGDPHYVMSAILRGAVPKLEPGEDLDPRMDLVIRHLLDRDPDARVQSADAASFLLGEFERRSPDARELAIRTVMAAQAAGDPPPGSTDEHRNLLFEAVMTYSGVDEESKSDEFEIAATVVDPTGSLPSVTRPTAVPSSEPRDEWDVPAPITGLEDKGD